MFNLRGNIDSKRFGYILLIPAIAMFATFSLYPLFTGIYISLTNFDIRNPAAAEFVAFDNFRRVLTDFGQGFGFYSSLLFTVIFALSVCVISYVVGFSYALILNQNFRFRGFYRGLLLVPWVIPPVVYATNWRWILNDQFGFINTFLMNNGIINEPILFLATRFNAQLTVILTGAWRSYPFMMLMILAGLQSIPDELYEAARVDGASRLRQIWHISLPGILPTIVILLVLRIGSIMGVGFEKIILLYNGHTMEVADVISSFVYRRGLVEFDFGYATAVGLFNSVVNFVFLVAANRLANKVTGTGLW